MARFEQLPDNSWEHQRGEVRLHIGESNHKHFVSLGVLWDGCGCFVSQPISVPRNFFRSELQEQGKEDILEIDVELGLRVICELKHGCQ